MVNWKTMMEQNDWGDGLHMSVFENKEWDEPIVDCAGTYSTSRCKDANESHSIRWPQIFTATSSAGPSTYRTDGGKVCKTKRCPQNCIGTWGSFSDCDPATGKKTKSWTKVKMNDAEGTPCPTETKIEENCATQCTGKWVETFTNMREGMGSGVRYVCDDDTEKKTGFKTFEWEKGQGGWTADGAQTYSTGPATCSLSDVTDPKIVRKHCKVDCEWNAWSNYPNTGDRGEACGTRTRTKKYDSKNGGAECTGNATDTINCSVDCEWNEWPNYPNTGDRGEACGTRTRTKKYESKNGGAECTGNASDNINCSVDCVGHWGPCDTSTLHQAGANGGYLVAKDTTCKKKYIIDSPAKHGGSCPLAYQTQKCCDIAKGHTNWGPPASWLAEAEGRGDADYLSDCAPGLTLQSDPYKHGLKNNVKFGHVYTGPNSKNAPWMDFCFNFERKNEDTTNSQWKSDNL